MTHRRISENLLDIVLNEGNCCCHEGGNSTNPSDDEPEVLHPGDAVMADIDEWYHTRDQIETSVDHGRGVDESGYRGRPLHRIGQPHVQWELGRLADRADEEHQKRSLQHCSIDHRATNSSRWVVKDDSEVERSVDIVQHQQSNHQENIAYTRSQESLLRGVGGTLLPVVEADEEV